MTKKHGIPAHLQGIADEIKASTAIDDKESIMSIKKRIKQIRESLLYREDGKGRGLNQPDFFSLIRPEYKGSDGQSMAAKWESQKEPLPPVSVLYRIAKAGGVSMEWLLTGNTGETPNQKETTWRDFCRVISDMKDVLNLSISLDNSDECCNEERDAMCTMTFPMQTYTPPHDDTWAGERPTLAHQNIGGFLYVMAVANGLPVWEDSEKYRRTMIHDALMRVPDTVPGQEHGAFGFHRFNVDNDDKK